MLSNIREMKKIIQISEKSLKEYSRAINLNYLKIREGVNLAYREYREIILEELVNSSIAKKVTITRDRGGKIYTDDEEANKNLHRLFQFLDNYYSFKTAKNFIIEANKVRNLIDSEGLANITDVDFDACEDFFIDINLGDQYLPIAIKFLKADYDIEINSIGKSFSSYNISVLTVKEDIITNLWSGIFIPDLYPRLYVDYNDYEHCIGCKYKNSRICNVKEMDSIIPVELCLVGRISFENCRLLTVDKGSIAGSILNMHSILGVVAHICRVFPNRYTVERKNSRIRKTYEKASIHIARNNTNNKDEDTIINLGLYAKNERYEKKEWQGGTHSSPVEHERRGHIRRYRDKNGIVIKEVEVRASVINKGNKRGIYKV